MFYNKRVVRCFLINCLALVVLILGLRLTLGGLAVPPFLANPKEDILVFRMLLYVFFGLLLVVLSLMVVITIGATENSLNSQSHPKVIMDLSSGTYLERAIR